MIRYIIIAADMHLNFKKIVINLFVFLGICFSSFAFATDYSITSSTTSQITLNNSDTLTVSGGGSIVYTGAAATTGSWKTFSSSATTILMQALYRQVLVKQYPMLNQRILV